MVVPKVSRPVPWGRTAVEANLARGVAHAASVERVVIEKQHRRAARVSWLQLDAVYRASEIVVHGVVEHVHLLVEHKPHGDVLASVPDDIVVEIERHADQWRIPCFDDIRVRERVLNVAVPHVLEQVVVHGEEAVRYDSVRDVPQDVVVKVVAVAVHREAACTRRPIDGTSTLIRRRSRSVEGITTVNHVVGDLVETWRRREDSPDHTMSVYRADGRTPPMKIVVLDDTVRGRAYMQRRVQVGIVVGIARPALSSELEIIERHIADTTESYREFI